MQCAKYISIIIAALIEKQTWKVGYFQRAECRRDYCWRSRPPASLWLANRWPLCQTWTTGQQYLHKLHIKSLSEQESLSVLSPVSLILEEQWVYFVCMYKVSDTVYKYSVFPNINTKKTPRLKTHLWFSSLYSNYNSK